MPDRSLDEIRSRNRGPRIILAVSMVPLCWLGMMLVHEFGHVLGAWISGGTVERVVWHPLALSRTDVSPNPAPLIVVWCGPIFGVLIPLAFWLICSKFEWSFVLRFFAGYCLVANGAYLGWGSIEEIGDCREMFLHGCPQWITVAFGIFSLMAGLRLWHQLGPRFGFGSDPLEVRKPVAVTVTAIAFSIIIAGFAFGRNV